MWLFRNLGPGTRERSERNVFGNFQILEKLVCDEGDTFNQQAVRGHQASHLEKIKLEPYVAPETADGLLF